MHIKELFDLTGKVAIITGGSVGLGRSMAFGLAEAGADVVVSARKVNRCEITADEIIKATGRKALPLRCDISQEEEVKAMINTTIKEFGKIDILVNNAGATWGATTLEYPVKGWKKVFDVNALGTFLCCREAGRLMIPQKRGKIINLTSDMAFYGCEEEKGMSAIGYQASKGAIVSMSRDLAVKWAKHNVQVNLISPSWFLTEMTEVTLDGDAGEKLITDIPMKRAGKDYEIKGAAVYLASAASDFVTGTTMFVDGGFAVS